MSLTGPIVYIEDDEDDQYMMKGVIQDLQIPNQLRFFADGEAAFEYLKATQEKPFLILCDINLPLLNGMELRRQIHDDEYLKKKCIPFIFISTAATPQEIEVAYDVTVQGFFQKTTTFEGLEKQVKSIIAYWQESLHPNRDF